MSIKVVKFGGSSLADAEHFRQVASIIKADPSRRYVVPSAPGKRERMTPRSPICSTAAVRRHAAAKISPSILL